MVGKMERMELKIKRISHDGVKIDLPRRATEGSAGLDLCAAVSESVTVNPRSLVRIPSGIAIGLPSSEYVGLVFARSGLAVKHGITLSNSVGVIDSDYTGEIIVGLCNLSDMPYTIEPGERIAQLVVMPVSILPIVEVAELQPTERAAGGFGSTGKF